MLTHHDTLVERSNLGIEIRLRKFWNPIMQTAERLLELGIDIIHIGIFSLSIGNQSLQGGILIEHQEAVADIGICDGAKLQHLLYQGTGFDGIIGVHLLKGREITGSKISTLQAVVTLHRQRYSISLLVRLELKFAS